MRCGLMVVGMIAFLVGRVAVAYAEERRDTGAGELFGTWVGQETEALGKKGPPEEAGKVRLVITKAKMTWQFDTPKGEIAAAGRYLIDPSKRPKEIDFCIFLPGSPGVIALAIYKVEGDRLTISMDRERPKDFDQRVLARLVFKKKAS